MERKFLEELGLEKELIDKILDQHSSEIGKLKQASETLTAERDGLKTQLDTAAGEIKSYKDLDVDGIKQKAADWEQKYNTDTQALKEQLAAEQYGFAVKESVSGFRFTSESAKKAFIADLMASHTPNPDFEGFVTNDDFVLAMDTSADGTAAEADYSVVQMGVTGLDSQLNPITQDKQYIRAGQSTTKTGTQRSFGVSGDRYISDEFQDFATSHAVKYGTGNSVVRAYVYFCILNGIGEKGKASIIVNSDAAGEAGNNAEIDIEIRKAGEMPVEYTYAPPTP